MFTAFDQYNVHSPLAAIALSLKTFLIWWRIWALHHLSSVGAQTFSDLFGDVQSKEEKEKRIEYFLDADSIYMWRCKLCTYGCWGAGGGSIHQAKFYICDEEA